MSAFWGKEFGAPLKCIVCIVRACEAYYYKDIVTWVCQVGQSWGPCDGFCGYSELRNDCLPSFCDPPPSLLFPFCTTHPYIRLQNPRSSHPTFPLAALVFATITALHDWGHLLIRLVCLSLCLGSAFLQYSLGPYYPTETWCTSASECAFSMPKKL